MGDTPPPFAGLFESLRKVSRAGVAVLQNRLELFAVELEEQKFRFVRALLLAGAGILLGNSALLAISVTIVVMAGARARVPVLIGLSLVYLAAAVWAFVALVKELRSAPPAFQETVGELKKDSEWLKPRS